MLVVVAGLDDIILDEDVVHTLVPSSPVQPAKTMSPPIVPVVRNEVVEHPWWTSLPMHSERTACNCEIDLASILVGINDVSSE